MAVTAIGRDDSFRGLRKLDPARDMRQVTSLVAQTFGARLDAEGRSALREMKQLSRFGPLIRFLLVADPQLQRMLNGYVWIEEGRVVGNLTLHGGPRLGSRWYIYNVAVCPEYRGRGIASALVREALAQVRLEGGEWATLQVEEDNQAAVHLYRSFGFEALSGLTFLHADQQPAVGAPPAIPGLRRWRAEDWSQQYELARASTPTMLQWWQPLRSSAFRRHPEDSLAESIDRAIGRRVHDRWVVERDQRSNTGLKASLTVTATRWKGEHHMNLHVLPEHRGSLERLLIQTGLHRLERFPRRTVTARHPSEHDEAIEAYQSFGLAIRRQLIVMRKHLR